MLKLVEHSHRGVWPSVDVTNFPSSQSLTLCVNLYQRHFHDWLPLLDKASFRFSEASPSLLLAMAAIGSEYSRGDVKHLGVALNELVRRGILFIVSVVRSLNLNSSNSENTIDDSCSR